MLPNLKDLTKQLELNTNLLGQLLVESQKLQDTIKKLNELLAREPYVTLNNVVVSPTIPTTAGYPIITCAADQVDEAVVWRYEIK